MKAWNQKLALVLSRIGYGTANMPQGNTEALERAIARADLTAACLRGAVQVLTLLGRDQESARKALHDAEQQAKTLHRMHDLLLASKARRGRAF